MMWVSAFFASRQYKGWSWLMYTTVPSLKDSGPSSPKWSPAGVSFAVRSIIKESESLHSLSLEVGAGGNAGKVGVPMPEAIAMLQDHRGNQKVSGRNRRAVSLEFEAQPSGFLDGLEARLEPPEAGKILLQGAMGLLGFCPLKNFNHNDPCRDNEVSVQDFLDSILQGLGSARAIILYPHRTIDENGRFGHSYPSARRLSSSLTVKARSTLPA